MRIRDGHVEGVDHELARRALQTIHDSPRKVYVEGRRFQVMVDYARLEGIRSWGETAYAGWSRPLHMGEILTCTGWRPGMDDTAEGVNWSGPRVPEDILICHVWPIQGLWTPWPMDGVLRALPGQDI